MLRREPLDVHDSHLRHLLDQRSARAAVAMDYDDAESVYSQFSPRPNAFIHETRSLHSYRAAPSPSPRPPETRNRLNELAESMLDLDDDSRDPSDEDLDPDDAEDRDQPEDARMSLLGPKMRFHGKAPWEMDGGVLEEEDEPESDRTSARGRDGIRKGLGFRSSSRGTTASSRPSGESSRSQQAKPKSSFETTSSANSPYGRGGALHALGQASISSTSLVHQAAPPQPGLRLNFPLPRSESPSSQYATPPRSPRSVTSSSNAPSPASRGNNHEYAHFPSNKPLMRRATNDSSASQSLYSEEMHPYANPDLVVSYADEASPASPARSAFNVAGVSRSDSTATVTESLATTTSRSVTGSALTPDTSASSMAPSQSPRSRVSMFHGKEISAPLPIQPGASTLLNHNISSPLVAPALPAGWTERSASPTFALISLEQARAQRARSATAQNLSISSTSSTPFPEVLTGESHDHSPTNSIAARARARSISTGARAKTALQNIVGGMPPKPERRDSEPSAAVQPGPSGGAAGKALKHKKSNGFMRLFNGARGTEKDEKSSPPPVPSLSDGYAAFNAQQQSGAKLAKVSSHRVPAPQVSPSMVEGPNMWDDYNRFSPTSRPTPPSLSINTGPQSRLRAASAADDFQTRTVPTDMSDRDWQQTDLPQSAPPNVTEFPALRLRPVSTLFSAHFGDHIVSGGSDSQQPGLDADVDTLSSLSPSTVVSPITPGMLLGRGSSSGDKAPMATISEDQSALVQSLQDQIVTAKKAWQRHIWELEGQVRDLKAEVDGLRAGDGEGYCDACGRGRPAAAAQPRNSSGLSPAHEHKAGVVNRPRARTGTSSRFGSAV
ncbi:hypothetical protein B0H17DRAFT_1036724 [Mycena rosella]|uniref:Uncharacterized protein n=1 Tax=Mycena rosella TaxID=1033263 RepID=A0AAD7M9A1_MYCRO|nr:hypothetical protein B0H17DRAFT_1036724 [Mycena rosella]